MSGMKRFFENFMKNNKNPQGAQKSNALNGWRKKSSLSNSTRSTRRLGCELLEERQLLSVTTGNEDYLDIAVMDNAPEIASPAMSAPEIPLDAMIVQGLDNTKPFVGQTIQVNLNAASDPAASYKWYRGDSATTITTEITGATSKSYKVVDADAKKFLKVVVTGSDGDTDSAQTASAVNTLVNSNVSLSNKTPVVGDTIKAVLNPTSATATYKWYRGDSADNVTTEITGATAATYKVVAADANKFLKVVATGSDKYCRHNQCGQQTHQHCPFKLRSSGWRKINRNADSNRRYRYLHLVSY